MKHTTTRGNPLPSLAELLMSEADIKRAIEEYLTYQMNLGNLWFERLNAGDFIEVRGETRRRVKGARKGTADYIVIQIGQAGIAFVTFLEIKRKTGKTTKEQDEFAERVRKLNCCYEVVRSVDEVEALLKCGTLP